jgi:SAM-dependent methyltransferase
MAMTESSAVETARSSLLAKPALDLFVVSFTILFFELTCIRWFGSTVVFLTFFTNLVLLACFLGMSVGCLAAGRDRNYVDRVIPLTCWTVLLSCAISAFYWWFGRVLVDVGNQGSPQQVYFGAEFVPKDPSYFVVPIEVVAGVFFLLIASIFVGLGQVMGRSFDAIPNRVLAYTANILGSLAGIAAFSIASFFWTPPPVWFLISLGGSLYFAHGSRWLHAMGLLAVLLLAGLFSGPRPGQGDLQTVWSPYYRVDYFPEQKLIATNNIGHQAMVRIAETGPGYLLPYQLNRDAKGPAIDEVLVVGAGSGNDVQAALASGASHVDAVEIDPAINALGRRNHPDRPYDDAPVSIHIDDGRSFLRRTTRLYDLVSYAVVDSLVLHSGYSSLRLESFLFTEQAFRDVKSRLKPGGFFAMYNQYRQGWVVGRLVKMAEKVFGTKPLVISLPYQERISPQDRQGNHLTLIMVANPGSKALDAIKAEFTDKQFYWVNDKPRLDDSLNAYGHEPPSLPGAEPGNWQKIGLAEVDTTGIGALATDDWPFLYLREPMIPGLNLRWIAMVAVLSLIILFLYAPIRAIKPNGQMFFLGAGFMLLETKGVVQMALLFGSTWMVNSIIFFAILVMILCSNLFVILAQPRQRWGVYYGFLVSSLLVNAFVPLDFYLGLPGPARTVVSCILVFLPIFFAGVIFALAFRASRQPDIDIGSNILGVIVGGLSESLSLFTGFNSLLMLAIGYYLVSALLGSRRLSAELAHT